ncbi:M20/M25/M40 family metallo-hydrolase [Sphingomonadaceae bacterium OTU29THOMA1]|nr:M20/M25/M40 family metallo-hydrolase [Sphingomonadaceae bacterium OTU29THOMA1]
MKRLSLAFIPALLMAAPGLSQTTEAEKTTVFLADLIRHDTSSPPGDTGPVAARLKALFDAAGIPNETILAPNGKAAHFIARVKGDGSKRPLLLAAHTDVVPADPTRWSVPPFDGVIKDGFLYGRGALDNKGAVAAFSRALLRIKADRVPLARDIIFLAEADEEQGSFNTNWLAANYWDKIDAEFVLNEGGSIRWVNGRVSELTISYSDKLTLNIRVRAEGPAGHSSRPLPGNQSANDQLIAGLARLASYREPIMLTATSRTYLERLATLHPVELKEPVARLLAASDEPARAAVASGVIAGGDKAAGWGTEGLLRNTIVLTMLQSGLKPNIIPGVAEATLNARLMPGTDIDAFLNRVRTAIGDDRIKVSVLEGDKRASEIRARSNIAPSSLDTDLYRSIERAAKGRWPSVTLLPTLLVASTDATPWRERGVPVYGIAPFPTEGSDAKRIHGDDERVSLEGIAQGSEFIHQLLIDAAGKTNGRRR